MGSFNSSGTVLPDSLRPYQKEGISFLFRNSSALLADDMGLGKTVQAISALRLLLRKPEVNRSLIVVPASLVLNWERELARWAPEVAVRRVVGPQSERASYYQLPVPVLIATYEQISADALDRIPDDTFDVVVLDEAQRIKNHSSRTAFACRLLPRDISWALTGTPVENTRSDIESIFAFLRPGLLRATDGRSKILESIAPHFLRRRKAEVLVDLPPMIVQDVSLELNPSQRVAYDEAWQSGTADLRKGPRPTATPVLLALITKLKQICNAAPDGNDSCKLDALQVLLESVAAEAGKVIVFSQYVQTLKWLATQLGALPTTLYLGEHSEAERDRALSEFQNSAESRVLLISLRAGGVGLNIPSADLVVLFDRWWNPAVEAQAMNRAHRFGRETPLHVVRFLVRDSVEERIDRILAAKRELFNDYVEAVESPEIHLLTRNDLVYALGVSHSDTDLVTQEKPLGGKDGNA
jgi:SNF2 family DNA or RNA helicase